MINQKTGIMIVSGVVAAVTSLVFTGSAMNLLGVRKTHNESLDPTIAGQQPVAPERKNTPKDDASDEEVETNL